MSKIRIYLLIFFVIGIILLSWAIFNIKTLNQKKQNTSQVNKVKSITKPTLPNIDIKDPNMKTVLVLYFYEGKITKLEKNEQGFNTITTDTKIQGLPQTWTYDKETQTMIGYSFFPTNNEQLKLNQKVGIGVSYTIQQKGFKPDSFRLSHVAILDHPPVSAPTSSPIVTP